MANLLMKFLLEVTCFATLAYTGAAIGSGLWAIALAVALPAVAIAVWARWNAPRSTRRLPPSTRIPLELAVFVSAALGLLVVGAVTWAAVYLSLVVVNAALLTALHQWDA
ncbi:YrdB family protein [Nocardioides insulae]|uniref:YrdB family protein n=1 Tax=Nocardioides insulae TaxID=394734 RepID=UPI00048EE555|nr:YrdB family protein [Nocardioides insulae]